MKRRDFFQFGAAASAMAAIPGAVVAQDALHFPTRPVTIVVPFTAGGPADAVVRVYALELSKRWGQPVLVDNRAGAKTIIGTGFVAAAPADGHTLLSASIAWVTNQYLNPKLPYSSSALAPVTLVGTYPEMLYLRRDIPAGNVIELAAWVKASGKPMSFANSGIGSSHHLAASAFADATGIPAMHVSYRGSAPAMQDVVGGQVDAIFEGMTFKQLADGARVKAMFVAQPDVLPEWPELPTARQMGLKDFEMLAWFGLLVPANTSTALQERIAADVGAVLRVQSVAGQLRKLGVIPAGGTPAAYTAFLDGERRKLGALIAKHRIVAE